MHLERNKKRLEFLFPKHNFFSWRWEKVKLMEGPLVQGRRLLVVLSFRCLIWLLTKMLGWQRCGIAEGWEGVGSQLF